MNVTTDGIIQNYVKCTYGMSVPNTAHVIKKYIEHFIEEYLLFGTY